jgi:hypothetical protein
VLFVMFLKLKRNPLVFSDATGLVKLGGVTIASQF